MATFGIMCIVLFGLAISLQSASAILCYDCGVFDSKCKDPFDKNAGVSNISCSGACSKIKAEGSGEQVVIRSCLTGLGTENKCEESTYQGIKSRVCLCSGDFCNGVLPVAGSFVVLVSSLVIYLALS